MSTLHVAQSQSPSLRAQRGVVLVVALIFLLLLTILAISASGRSLLQERMAGGLRNAQQAQMSAETALRGAEWRLWKSTSAIGGFMKCGSGSFTGTDSCYRYDPNGADYAADGTVYTFRTSQAWLPSAGTEYQGPADKGYKASAYSGDTKTAALANNPRYIIEDMGVELPPGVGTQHESGATGSYGSGYESTSRHIYRITARATGGNANTLRVAESTFAAKSN